MARRKDGWETCDTVHNHMCDGEGCGTVWRHDPAKILTDTEGDEVHKCPRCGKRQVWIYHGDVGPSFIEGKPVQPPSLLESENTP